MKSRLWQIGLENLLCESPAINHATCRHPGNELERQAGGSKYDSCSCMELLFQHIPYKIFFKDKKLRYLVVNQAYAYDFGLNSSDFPGKTDYELFPQTLAEKYRTDDSRILRTGQQEVYDEEYIDQEGKKRFVHTTKLVVKSAADEILGVLGVFWDITERKKEENLQKSIFEFSQDLICVLDSQMQLKKSNPAWTSLLGWNDEQLANFNWRSFVHPEEQKLAFKAEQQLKAGEAVHNLQLQLQSKDGSYKTIAWNMTAGLEHDEVYAVGRDVTASRKSHEKLQDMAETQNVMVKEINHRVKNNLAAIIGMIAKEQEHARLTGDLHAYEKGYEQLILRVKGFSLVHSMFSLSSWQPVNLAYLCDSVIKGSLQNLLHNRAYTVLVHPSSVSVNSHVAHNISLILNEISTNFFKYVVPQHKHPCLEVFIHINGEQVQLSFQDNGNGYPASVLNGEKGSYGMGLSLIKSIVHKSLRGKIFLSSQDGAATRLTFPCERSNDGEDHE